MYEKIYEERNRYDVLEHRHIGYDYWHPVTRVHSESTKDQLPAGHVISKKPLSEKLYMDRVEVTPIQMMELGKSLEIGAVWSLMEGLLHHRYAASIPIEKEFVDTSGGCISSALFYAEWEPNHSTTRHRYLIQVSGENVYVGYFPYDGRGPRLYGIHHKKQDVVKFLHKTHSGALQIPELTLLTELNIPNIRFEMETKDGSNIDDDLEKYGVDHVGIFHSQGYFYTRSFYGEFTPLSECKFIPDPDSGNTPETVKGHWDETTDATGYNMGNPKRPYYMFQGALGYVQLYEGKMFCYPDGSIRFLPKDVVFTNDLNFGDQPPVTVFTGYIDLQIVQGDLVAYELEGHTVPEPQPIGQNEYSIDMHKIVVGYHEEPLPESESEEVWHDVNPSLLKYDNLEGLYIKEDCVLTITHPEHGETKYEAMKGEMLALLPGTSRPFQRDEGRD